jgi:hypothetical protein
MKISLKRFISKKIVIDLTSHLMNASLVIMLYAIIVFNSAS